MSQLLTFRRNHETLPHVIEQQFVFRRRTSKPVSTLLQDLHNVGFFLVEANITENADTAVCKQSLQG